MTIKSRCRTCGAVGDFPLTMKDEHHGDFICTNCFSADTVQESETPPALGVSVDEKINTGDQVGG